MADDTILSMRGITKEFPGVRALDEVRLDVRRGEIHSICGENGAGKSTLMKVLSGVYPHGSYTGEIHFEGREVEFKGIRDSERAGIVIIHQELALIPQLSITENLFLGNETSSRGAIDWLKARRRAVELLANVGLHEDPDVLIRDIGIGKQQLVEIAKALAKDVKLLILDEPTAALNDTDSQNLLSLLDGLRERGITCIMISHKLGEIEQVSDSITIIRDGRTIETLDVSAGGVDEDRIIRGMVGRDLDHRYPPHESSVGEVLLEIRDWTVAHPADPNRLVVRGANLTVRRGEIVGLAGLMGAGRTELARSVFGESYGTKRGGTLLKDGKEIRARNVGEAIKAGLAYVTEDRKALGLNLLDSIKVSITSAGLTKIRRNMAVDDNAEVVAAERYRKSLNIKAPSVDVGVNKLSGGNQQKVVLGKWMFTEPDVLILDEPTRGIDVGAKYEIYEIINQLADTGRGVLVISSELPELLGICDRIYTLSAGVITADVPRADADQELLMRHMTQRKAG
ncbi:multiple monosaccharide ABC transporter ATP-binding protein [Phycicoccus duodecadis]|uniref:Monosaccharide ABC transporter ATP-binding protein (CUT2 family) n=1 Tax=Phycicoccus duodecadis TaxID=173053 RepID=A0A2N3YIU8_9MICO|nr:multiple monosaccharide ABC transporter ATP-binding protein [Phycicoccus duodecadis]PKW26784.1 monosaccharide ABC transporter ATP-binding protein (CUT2 family) [Phycicoccus duodecadis]